MNRAISLIAQFAVEPDGACFGHDGIRLGSEHGQVLWPDPIVHFISVLRNASMQGAENGWEKVHYYPGVPHWIFRPRSL
jgi:hypothetical protein